MFLLTVASISALIGTTLARSDACAPPTTLYRAVTSPNWAPCAATKTTGSVVEFSCGINMGTISYNFKDNVISIQSGSGAKENQFTIHGACREGTAQVAHVDLFTVVTNQVLTFPGMNRKCDIKKPGMQAQFWTYTLSQPQIDDCLANHRVYPGSVQTTK